MKRVCVAALLAIALAACATTPVEPDRTPLPSGHIEIFTHCGLDGVRIDYQGSTWRFDQDVPEQIERWGINTTVVQVVPGGSGPVVIAQDGTEWVLIPADPADTPPPCI